jgi:hypothetical protein
LRSVSLHRTPSNPQRLVGSPANPGRPVSADSGEATHARCPKPGSAMHRLWFSHEAGGDRAGPAGPGLANVFLPTMQASPAPRHRQCRDRSVGSAKTVGPLSSNPGPGTPLAALPSARARETPLGGGFPRKCLKLHSDESVFLSFIGFGFFCDGSAMLERAPDTQEVPTRVCNGCGAQMKHLADHRSSGTHPAERIFVCDGCRSVASERR